VERAYNSFGAAPGSSLGFAAANSGNTTGSFKPQYVPPGATSYQNVRIDFGWRLSYDRALTVLSGAKTTATLYRGDSKTRTFTLTNGVWTPDPGQLVTTLTQQVDGGGNTVGFTYVNENDEAEKYDANGRLISITSRSGLVQSLQYVNIFNLLSSVTDAFGRKLTLTYNGSGILTGIADPSGGKYSYTYDGKGNLSSVTYPDGHSRQYVYENTQFVHALTGIIDENGTRFATWAYDSQGNAISSEHAAGVGKVVLSYPAATSSTATDANGTTRSYTSQVVNGIAKAGSISEAGTNISRTRSMTYDAHGNLATGTDYNGNVTTYQYDLTRDLETSRVEASGTLQARTITTTWHPVWRVPVKIAEPNKLTTLMYNGDGGSYCAPNTALSNGQPIGVVCQKIEQATSDATGSQGVAATVVGTPTTWRYTYNADGQILTAAGPRTDVNDATTYSYRTADDTATPPQYRRGDLYSVTDALGHATTFDRYDLNGRPLQMTDANGTVTTLTYSPRGWLTSRTVTPASSTPQTTAYAYDYVGQLTQVTQPAGSSASFTYDGAHRMTGAADSLGNSIAYTLDAMGNRTQEQSKDPGGSLARQITRVFDAINRPLKVTVGSAP